MKMVNILTKNEISILKKSCKLAANTLLFIDKVIKPGISTWEINSLVHEYIVSNKAYPSPLNYRGFPASVCTSINDVLCHGIPSKNEILKNGDIINVDVTTYFPKENGFHGDTSVTFYIGEPIEEVKKLVEVTRQSLNKAIEVVRPGKSINEIGAIIQEYVESNNLTVVKDFIGHGVGRKFHEPPAILHYKSKQNWGELIPGMVFTIEPIVNLGSDEYYTLDDGWTIKSCDGKQSAQFEHTILVTEEGCEVLTARDGILSNSEIY